MEDLSVDNYKQLIMYYKNRANELEYQTLVLQLKINDLESQSNKE